MPGWARWDRWSRSSRWGGGVVFYAISGQINDASGSGLDGVTVTLTGTASDSVVTAGGGLYEFVGLNPGSYTVTPTKGGYTFSPLNAAVTIVGANKVATTMAAVWMIAGTILDGSSPIAGVTVTLTGDASDSTTTDGSGNYEFTTLSDGNYTVTPTKVNHTFTPTSSPETVAGADVDSDFVGTEWLLLDLFLTPDAAPITSPRTCEPGPGTLTVTDTGNNADIVADEFKITGVAGHGDPGLYGDLSGDVSTRVPGLAVVADIRIAADAEGVRLALEDAADGSPSDAVIYQYGNDLRIIDTNAVTVDSAFFSYDIYTKQVVILRAAGAFFVVDGKLYWVGNTNTSVLDTAIIASRVAATDSRANKLGALSLPANGYAEWDADFSTVTDAKTNPADNVTFDVDADFSLEHTFTVEDGKFVQIAFRRTNTSNYIFLEVSTSRALLLRKRVIGSFTTMANYGALTDTVGYNFKVVGVGDQISVFLDNVLQGTETVTDFTTVSGGRVDHNLASNDIVLSTHPYPALGIATDRVIAPQTTDTFTHTADFLAYIRNVTLPTAGSTEYFFRITGSDEITLQLVSDGSLVLLDNATSKITAVASTITNGQDVALICTGANGEVFVAGTSAGSTSTIAVTAGTAGKRLDAQDGVCDSIELFPGDVASLLPAELT